MALPRGDKHDILTHENPKHDCLRPYCSFDDCAQCDCADAKGATHCQHCYHCEACSTAVSRGCRKCSCSPDQTKYRSYVGGRRGCDSDERNLDCKVCYPDDTPIFALQDDLCRVDWSDEDRLAADRADIQEKTVPNHAESHTPPGSPPR